MMFFIRILNMNLELSGSSFIEYENELKIMLANGVTVYVRKNEDDYTISCGKFGRYVKNTIVEEGNVLYVMIPENEFEKLRLHFYNLKPSFGKTSYIRKETKNV